MLFSSTKIRLLEKKNRKMAKDRRHFRRQTSQQTVFTDMED